MAWCKTAAFPLLKHWRYCSLAPSHRYVIDEWGFARCEFKMSYERFSILLPCTRNLSHYMTVIIWSMTPWNMSEPDAWGRNLTGVFSTRLQFPRHHRDILVYRCYKACHVPQWISSIKQYVTPNFNQAILYRDKYHVNLILTWKLTSKYTMNSFMHSSVTFCLHSSQLSEKNVWLPPQSDKVYPPREASLRQRAKYERSTMMDLLNVRIVSFHYLLSATCTLHERICYYSFLVWFTE